MKHSVIYALCLSISMILFSLSNTSCICQKIAPHFAQVQSLISDAELALNQAQQFIDSIKTIPDDIKTEFDAEIQKGYSSLQLISQGLTEATQACNAVNFINNIQRF